jgi:hypothetical protein
MRLASGCGVKIVPVYNKPFLYRYKPHKKQKFFRYFAASECYGPAEYVGRSKTIGKIHFQVLACEAYCRYPTYRGMEDPTGSTESKLMASASSRAPPECLAPAIFQTRGDQHPHAPL